MNPLPLPLRRLRAALQFPLARIARAAVLFGMCASIAAAQESIDPRSGRLILSVSDLVLPAGSVELDVQRSWVEHAAEPGLLGARWRLNWEARARKDGAAWIVERGLRVDRFERRDASGPWQSAGGDALTVASDGKITVEDLGGTKTFFDGAGRLTGRDERNGNIITVVYAANGRIDRVDGPRRAALRFILDGGGRLTRLEGSDGQVVTYGYAAGRLASVEGARLASSRYVYNRDEVLAHIDDSVTESRRLAYDVLGRVTERRWGDNASEHFEYDDAALTVRRRDVHGALTVLQWSKDGREQTVTSSGGGRTVMTFDAAGRLIRSVGPDGAATTLTYDSLGRMIGSKGAGCCTKSIAYAGNTSRPSRVIAEDGTVTEFHYDAQGNLTQVKSGSTIVSEISYNSYGLPTVVRSAGGAVRKLTYDDAGRLTALTDSLGRTGKFEYDRRGNLVREVDAAGGVTTLAYDARDRVISTTNPIGAVTRYEYDAAHRVVGVTDALGRKLRIEYDAMGRRSATTDHAGRTTRYDYARHGAEMTVTAPDGLKSTTRHNSTGQIEQVTDEFGQATRFSYDALGRVKAIQLPGGMEERFEFDQGGRMTVVETPGAGSLRYAWDDSGRLASTTYANGGIERYQYGPQSRLTSLTNPLGRVQQYQYGAAGELQSVKAPGGDTVRYDYDAEGQLTAVHVPTGGAERFAYNARGQLAEITSPHGARARREYDAAGRLILTTDFSGRGVRHSYDGIGRLVRMQPESGGPVNYLYTNTDLVRRIDDGKFPIEYSYDAKDRLAAVNYVALRKSVKFETNERGQRTRLVATDGRRIDYRYDSQHRLQSVLVPGGGLIKFGYDKLGRVHSIAYPNGVVALWAYDDAARVKSLAYRPVGAPSLASWSYRYDAADNPVAIERTPGAASEYRYDANGRLAAEVTAGKTTSYQYLPGGNRAKREGGAGNVDYKYDSTGRLTQARADKFTYDPNGNLVQREGARGKTSYTFDEQGQLTRAVAADGAEIKFGYAATGERISREDKTAKTFFVYDGLNLLEELDANGRSVALYIHAAGLDRPLAMIRGGQTYYYHADPLGTVAAITDAKGAVVASYETDAFGNITAQKGSVKNPFVFSGREYEPALGLHYFRARYYDPELGRFLSPDPIQPALNDPAALNRYVYARNAPTRYGDPLGTSDVDLLLWAEQMINNAWKTGQQNLSPRQLETLDLANHIIETNHTQAVHSGLRGQNGLPTYKPINWNNIARIIKSSSADIPPPKVTPPAPPPPPPPAAPPASGGGGGGVGKNTLQVRPPAADGGVPRNNTVPIQRFGAGAHNNAVWKVRPPPPEPPVPTPRTPSTLINGGPRSSSSMPPISKAAGVAVGGLIAGGSAYAHCMENGGKQADCLTAGAIGGAAGAATGAITSAVIAAGIAKGGTAAVVATGAAVGGAVLGGVLGAIQIVKAGGEAINQVRDGISQKQAEDNLNKIKEKLGQPGIAQHYAEPIRRQLDAMAAALENQKWGVAAQRELDDAQRYADLLNAAIGEIDKLSVDPAGKPGSPVDASLKLYEDIQSKVGVVRAKAASAVSLLGSAQTKEQVTAAAADLVAAARNYGEASGATKRLTGDANQEKVAGQVTELSDRCKKYAGSAAQCLLNAQRFMTQYRQGLNARPRETLEYLVRQTNNLARVTPPGPGQDELLQLAGRAEDLLSRVQAEDPPLATLENRYSVINEQVLGMGSSADSKLVSLGDLFAKGADFVTGDVDKLLTEAKEEVNGAVVVFALRAKAAEEKKKEVGEQLKETKQLGEDALKREQHLKEQRSKRETVLKAPNLNPTDANRYRQEIQQINQTLAKNDRQKSDVAKKVQELDKQERDLADEAGLLGMKMAEAESAIGGR